MPENELMIDIKGCGWLYFATAEQTAETAIDDFFAKVSSAGINWDNGPLIVRAELRNPDGEQISAWDPCGTGG